jgi:hypothetical protein
MGARHWFFLTCCSLLLAACRGATPTAPSPNPAPPAELPAPPGRLNAPVINIALAVGEVVHMRVGLEDPICDPSGWDASAPCKRFEVRTPRDGTLHAILKTAVSKPVDLLMACTNGALAYSGEGQEQRITVVVDAGRLCVITVNLYPYMPGGSEGVEFELRTEL